MFVLLSSLPSLVVLRVLVYCLEAVLGELLTQLLLFFLLASNQQVKIEDNVLSIAGQRKEETEEKLGTVRRSERR